MTRAWTFYRSSIGKKTLMAITGLIGVGFVLIHMIGNLQVYLGPAYLNEYGDFLRGPVIGELLWVARAVLLAAVVTHVYLAIQLTIENRKSRPVSYAYGRRTMQATPASRSLRWGGIFLFLFIIYHVLHITLAIVPGSGPRDASVYNRLVLGFQNPIVVVFYLLSMLALGLHIWHGAWSLFQTLGLNNSRYNRMLRNIALTLGVALFIGNISIPLSVMVGFLKPN